MIRLLDESEVDAWAEAIYATDVFEGEPLDVTKLRCMGWWDDPMVWPIVITWNGAVVQYDLYEFDAKKPELVRAGINIHVMRERPYRFFHELTRPVLDALELIGITRVDSFVIPDRDEWVEMLTTVMGGRRVRQTPEGYTHVRFDLAALRDSCPGWPQPRTAGAGWTWTHGNVTVREATAAELAALAALVTDWWSARLDVVVDIVRLAQEWTVLDGGTCIIGTVDGVPTFGRVVRQRRPDVASVFGLSPMSQHPEEAAFIFGLLKWHEAVGYVTSTALVPDSCQGWGDLSQALSAELGRRRGTGVGGSRFREPHTEVSCSVATRLAEGVDTFVQRTRRS